MTEQHYPLESLEAIELAHIYQLEGKIREAKQRLVDNLQGHFKDIYQKAVERVAGREKFQPLTGDRNSIRLYFPTAAVQRYPLLSELPPLAQSHILHAHFEYNAEVTDFLLDHPTYGDREYYSIDISHWNISTSLLVGGLIPEVNLYDEEKSHSAGRRQYLKAGSDNELYLWTIQILRFTRWAMDNIPSGYLGRAETGRSAVKWMGIEKTPE